MKFDELPQETQEQIMMIGHRSEIEVEDDKRRQSTRLGYRFGGIAGMVFAMGMMVVASALYIVGLAVVAPSLDIQMSTSPLFWLGFLPLALIPIVPFLFLKLHYALRALAIVAAILVVGGLLAGLGTWIEGVIVHALV